VFDEEPPIRKALKAFALNFAFAPGVKSITAKSNQNMSPIEQ